jgi:hypothetical protein
MARCGRGRVSVHLASGSFCSQQVKLTVPSGSIATSRAEHTTRLTVRRLSSRPHRLCRRRGFPSTCGQDFKLPARPIGWRKIYGSPGVSCIALDRPIGLSCDLFIRSLAYQLKFA